jgi:hypothetical protein
LNPMMTQDSSPLIVDPVRERSAREWWRWLPRLWWFGWSTVLLGSAFQHVPWRDEANWYLMMREADAWTEVFGGAGYVRFTGAGWLWYAGFVWPLGALDVGIVWQSVVSAAMMAVAAGLALRLERLPVWFVVVWFTSSFMMAYDWAVVGRGYSLSVMLAMAALLRRQRTGRFAGALVGLLANTSAWGFVLAAAMAAGWVLVGDGPATASPGAGTPSSAGRFRAVIQRLRESPWMVLLFVVAVATAIPHPEFVRVGHEPGVEHLMVMVRQSVFPFERGWWAPLAAVLLIVLPLGVLAAGRAWEGLVAVLAGLVGMSVIVSALHAGMPRHHGFVVVLLVVAVATSKVRREWFLIPLAAALVGTGLPAVLHFHGEEWDRRAAFSGGGEVAEFIRAMVPADATVVFSPNSVMAPVLVHLDPSVPARVIQMEEPGTTRRYFLENASHARGLANATDESRLSVVLAAAGPGGELPWIVATQAGLPADLSLLARLGYVPAFQSTRRVFGANDESYVVLAPPPIRR